MIVFAQLSPVILEGLRENASDLFYSWPFCSVRHCTSKGAEWSGGKSEPQTWLHPEGNSSNLLLSHKNNETWFDELTTTSSWGNRIQNTRDYFYYFFRTEGQKCGVTHERKEIKDHAPMMELGLGVIHNYITATKSLCWVCTHVYTSSSCLMWVSVAKVLGPSCKEAVSWGGNDEKRNNTQTHLTILAGW